MYCGCFDEFYIIKNKKNFIGGVPTLELVICCECLNIWTSDNGMIKQQYVCLKKYTIYLVAFMESNATRDSSRAHNFNDDGLSVIIYKMYFVETIGTC